MVDGEWRKRLAVGARWRQHRQFHNGTTIVLAKEFEVAGTMLTSLP